MITQHPFKNNFLLIVSFLYILLFVYASFSKILEFGDFQTQLGQSPLLGAYATIVSYGVIISELLVSGMLAFEKTRRIGLFGAYTLMVMFTAYIIIILNFTTFTPCSCGGVLESLGWTAHLIFNIVFILLNLIAVYHKSVLKPLIILFLSAVFSVVLLFLLADKEIKSNNAFIRQYIPHALEKIGEYKLESNAFYIAGMDEKTIYLGNYNAPLYLKLINSNFKSEEDVKIEIDKLDLPYQRVRISIVSPFFFLGDGTVPILFRGSVNDWKAESFSYQQAYFLEFTAIDSLNVGIVTSSKKTNANVLGKLTKQEDSIHVKLSYSVLKKQLDGTFDTDGIFLWNGSKRQFLYLYYYRNQYELSDADMNFISTGKTIDTISKAQLDIAYYKDKDQHKLGSSVTVNRMGAVHNQYLYINSDRLGKYEDDEVLSSASIIDVYDTSKNVYRHSFYLYHQLDGKLTGFKVQRDTLAAIVGNRLWLYKIKEEYYE